jgi:type II secretory pathway pseudopilin PulG
MTELMVVVAIIAVLAGILLTAMGGVRRRAMSTQTQSTMQEFAKACEAFQLEHNRYPGMIPEQALANLDALALGAIPISGTENALLDLMGGARAKSTLLNPTDPDFEDIPDCDPTAGNICPNLDDVAWELRVAVNRIGEGPKINGRLYAPYFTPTQKSLQAVEGQKSEPSQDVQIPDLVDSWGQPIIYVRRARSSGKLVGDSDQTAQFYIATMKPYTESAGLGRLSGDQEAQSILNVAAEPEATFAQILRHPGFGSSGTVAEAQHNTPRVVEEYDDLRVFGGG